MSHISLKSIEKIIMILLGNLLYSFAIAFFILPSGLITGGTTGIALFVNYLTGFDISLFVLIFNIVMFIVGFLILGKTFALSTVLSSICYPFMLSLGQRLNLLMGDLTHDLILCTVFGGLLIGIGIGIVIRAGASTGGMDIPPLVLNKKLGINVSVSLYVFDFTILILQMFFSNREQILYGILLVCIYTFALEKVLIMGKSKTQVEIVSDKYKEINELNKYNYVVVNDEIDKATRKVNAILEAQKCMVERIEEVYLNNPEEEIHELLIDDKDFDNNELNV